VSPILSNIYLDRLDKFVETVLLPAYNREAKRKSNRSYEQLRRQAKKLVKAGHYREARLLRRQMRQLPSYDPDDPAYRRLRYLRYADDFLLGFSGPRSEAEEIKQQLKEFLRDDLNLELSESKTLITHARTEAARFLGYEITVTQDNQKRDQNGRRNLNGIIGLRVPMDVLRAKCAPYLRHGKPALIGGRVNDTEFSIIATYQQEYRGLVEYYRLAHNIRTLDRLKWVMEMSLAHTLSAKLQISVPRVFARLRTIIQTDRGPKKVLQVKVDRGRDKAPLVAQWGGISLARRMGAILNDHPPRVWNGQTELLERLLADTCELCGSQEDVEVHHVRHLKDLQRKGRAEKPTWVQAMAARQRKTLVVCRKCHWDIHAGRPTRHKVAP